MGKNKDIFSRRQATLVMVALFVTAGLFCIGCSKHTSNHPLGEGCFSKPEGWLLDKELNPPREDGTTWLSSDHLAMFSVDRFMLSDKAKNIIVHKGKAHYLRLEMKKILRKLPDAFELFKVTRHRSGKLDGEPTEEIFFRGLRAHRVYTIHLILAVPGTELKHFFLLDIRVPIGSKETYASDITSILNSWHWKPIPKAKKKTSAQEHNKNQTKSSEDVDHANATPRHLPSPQPHNKQHHR